jgi:Rrf2 family protein
VTIITRKSDYAARVLLHLAALPPGSWTTAQRIADRQSIPNLLVGQIVSQLAKAGLLLTRRGKGGGIQMARPAAEISLLDVVEAMQGPLSLNVCTSDPEQCALTPECLMHEAWVRTQASLDSELRGETLEKLVGRSTQSAAA